jgi:hypothetical protein
VRLIVAVRNKRRILSISYSALEEGKPMNEQVSSFDSLVKRLESLAKELFRPAEEGYNKLFGGVYLHNAAADVMGVGLTDEGWLLMYGKANRNRTDFSLGNPRARGEVEYCFQQWESLPKKYLIPREKALKVLRYWYETGRLSRSIKSKIEEF